jgi:NAD(P)H-dependent FMN reductase
VTPEDNNSIPGPFKNAIDWLSRPASDIPRVFHERPVALMGATPGSAGTTLAQEGLVAGAAHAANATVVWRAPGRVASDQGIR